MILNKSERTEIVIDLTGSDGNAYFLLGYAKSFCKQMGLNYEIVSEEMKSSDYENLVMVFDEYFGDYVTLLR